MRSTPGLPRDWIPTLMRLLERQPTVARVVVTEARGSTPREPGAFMLIGHNCVEGSIGGGRLEWEAIAAGRALLAEPAVPARTNQVVLAADVGQCCGGVVSLWLEKFTRNDLALLRNAADAGSRGVAVLVSEVTAGVIRRSVVRQEVQPRARPIMPAGSSTDTTQALTRLLSQPRQRASPVVVANGPDPLTFLERLDDNLPAVWLYGAGHVGQALARILMELPLRLTWIDSRPELFPQGLPDAVRVLQDPDPVATVHEAPVGAYLVVMSHSHPLDFDLCHALLERNDFAWLGLIGSDSKAARFRSRLARAGLDRTVIEKLVCPIGVTGITSKWPAAIAVAVAAQLMQTISMTADEQMGTGPELPPRADLARPQRNQAQRSNTEALRAASTPRVASATEPGTSQVEPATGRASPAAPCAPELCATCGTPAASEHSPDPDALARDTVSSSTATTDPRHDTVPS